MLRHPSADRLALPSIRTSRGATLSPKDVLTSKGAVPDRRFEGT